MYHFKRYHYRRRYKTKPEGTLALILLAFFIVLLVPAGYAITTLQSALPILIIISVLLSVVLIGFLFISHRRKLAALQAVQLSDIDTMSGIQFEHYVGYLLERQGYQIHYTKATGDLGTDIVASKENIRYSIQLKRYKVYDHVSRVAVSDAIGAMRLYKCEASMVITSSYFTRDARKLARSNHTILVDREQLGQWIMQFHQSKQ